MTSGINVDILEAVGKLHIVDMCVESFKQKKKDEAYKLYIADCFKMITENSARFAGGKYMTARFADVIGVSNRTKAKLENDAKKIKTHIMDGINALGKGGGEVGP